MKKYKIFKIYWTAIMLLTSILVSYADAADQKDTAGVTMQIPSMCKLTINESNQVIDLFQDASGEEAYELGYIQGQSNRPNLLVSANTNWKLSAAVSVNWNVIGGYQKETQDLMLKVASSTGHQTGFTDYAPLSMIDQEIARYTKGSGREAYNCTYRIKLDWAKDVPGIYSIVISYTLSTQPF